MILSFGLSLTFFFCLGLSFVTSQEREPYICSRLVTEKPRCKIYNYRHPLCKKWDHSQCPPPHIIRDTSQCVHYKCVKKLQKSSGSESYPLTTTLTPPALTASASESDKEELEDKSESEEVEVEEEKDTFFSSELAQRQINFLRSEIVTLRRVFAGITVHL